MMDIFNMLGGMGKAQQTVGQQLGTSPQQTQSAMEAAVPLLLGALTRNATQPGGLDALSGALGRHDGSALDAFSQGQAPDVQDGQKILGHVFGGQQQQAAQAVGRRAGIDPQLAMQILSMAAPLVMAYLSRQRQGNQGGMGQMNQGQMGGAMQGGGMDIGSILGGLLGGGAAGGLGGMLGGMLGGGQPQQMPQQHHDQQNYGQGSVLGGGQVIPGLPQQQGQMGQPQQGGGLLGTLNGALDQDGDGNALDDLIGMFGGQRR
ncbi:DUF937 domain-containing protein [Deinococcus koreensis]|uniref:DUF937 domain-containing protein n=1 Tax=Deinococcus koreensis TaxID=2054903 RepID=A0A2K3V0L3_9DEIO|nr:DUF937 domain-containing protein [Deinococcus koreensis]PNY82324.1 hypothetical protein CVO96_14005 [Deinococcus koreensis]